MMTNEFPSVKKQHKIITTIKSFSLTERFVFTIFMAIFVISGLYLVSRTNNRFLVEVPEKGGSIEEGVVGTPRFINPVLAMSDADKDMTSLIYSGLLRVAPDGELVGDLAKEYKISADGLVYTFVLKDTISFQDGKPITADDVEFTIQRAQDPTIKSPRRANWDGVIVQKINSKEIRFILKQPYAPFLENATMGILPQHLWKDVPADEFSFNQLNVSPIGSGPYRVKTVKRDPLGLPIYYSLIPFKKYALGEPFISSLVFRFYTNEEDALTAYKSGEIESLNGISPRNTLELKERGARIETAALPRIFAVFFNQNQAPLFTNDEVREALSIAIDKERIIREVLSGYGSVINSPVTISNESELEDPSHASSTLRIQKATDLLTKNGWVLNQKNGILEKKTKKQTFSLKFSISTGDAPELKQAAEIVKDEWTKIGAIVDIKIFETGDLNQNVIRPRKYDALLFGEIVGRDQDLYPFWHSSQRNDPGLNVAMYTNIKADKLLEGIRITSDKQDRQDKYEKFKSMLIDDAPAVFMYSPDFIYVVPEKVKNLALGQITNPSERFLNVSKWYINTSKIWKIFSN
jgi:peptide/nickel transport system substrate-binding protein